jgi:purine catabolism regulator
MHRSVAKLALGQPSTYGILSEIKRSLGFDTTFYNRTSNISIPTDSRYTTFDVFDLEEMERGPYQTLHYYRAWLTLGKKGPSVLAVLIPSQNHVAAYLVIHADPTALDTLDFMSVENYVTLLQMEMLKQNAVEDALYQHNSAAVHDLLHNRYSTREAIDRALKELSIDALPLYQTMLVRFHFKDSSQQPRLRDLIDNFTRSVQRSYSHLVVYINDNRVVFLRNLSNVSQEFQLNIIKKILQRLHANADMPEFTHFVALSNSYGRYDISRAHSEVMGMFRLFELSKDINRCLRYQDFGIYKLFLHVEDIKDIEAYIDPKVSRLIKENPTFFETIAVLCEKNISYNETARILCVHPKTVHYRINRTRELYEIDVHNMEDVSQVIISEKILTLIGQNWRSTGELDA